MTLDFKATPEQFRKQINELFKNFKIPKIKIYNDCLSDKKITLNLTQQFISNYYTPKNPNGLLLYHSIGSGKTLTAINLLKQFEKYNFNILWVTRTTLRKDLDKALTMLPLKNKLIRLSYKQFSNILKRKGKNYQVLLEKAKRKAKKISPNKTTNDPLFKTIVVIDEAHKLYTKDLKIQEMHDIKTIENMIFESYSNSKENRTRIVLMSATPITENTNEVLNLLNLLITNPNNRININNFNQNYINSDGSFDKDSSKQFQSKIKDLVSYIDISNDPSKFAQINYKNILIPVSEKPSNIETDLRSCNDSYRYCKELEIFTDSCKDALITCRERVNTNKTAFKGITYQKDMLNKKCGLNL